MARVSLQSGKTAPGLYRILPHADNSFHNTSASKIQREIGVSCFEQGGEDDAAGGDAVENQRVNVIRAENHGEVSAGEGTDTMLDDDDFASFGAMTAGIAPSGS